MPCVDDAQRLRPIGAAGVIDHKARRVGCHDRLLADAADEAGQRLDQMRVAAQAADHLDQPHQRRRIEKMQAADARGAGAAGGDLGHRQRRGVGGDDRVGRDALFQFAHERVLGGKVFDDCLDDDPGGLHVVERADRPQARKRAFLASAVIRPFAT